jgi:hypothetical protein
MLLESYVDRRAAVIVGILALAGGGVILGCRGRETRDRCPPQRAPEPLTGYDPLVQEAVTACRDRNEVYRARGMCDTLDSSEQLGWCRPSRYITLYKQHGPECLVAEIASLQCSAAAAHEGKGLTPDCEYAEHTAAHKCEDCRFCEPVAKCPMCRAGKGLHLAGKRQ